MPQSSSDCSPHQHLFIQQIPSFDLLQSTLNRSLSGDFSGITFTSICYFSFLGNIKQNYCFSCRACVRRSLGPSRVLSGRWRAKGCARARLAGSPGPPSPARATPASSCSRSSHFIFEKFQRQIPGLSVTDPFFQQDDMRVTFLSWK